MPASQQRALVTALPVRVCVPSTLPPERLLLGELHLVRSRLDRVLAQLGRLVTETEGEQAWLRVEEASRLARRAVSAAVAAAPPIPPGTARSGTLQTGRLQVDPATKRQWYGEVEFELTPLHHRLLAVMAADPYRVFAKDELLREVWQRAAERTNSVNTSVSRVRRALVRAGAPQGLFMLSLHGVGWALTRPE